jgi:hypothetical protein
MLLLQQDIPLNAKAVLVRDVTGDGKNEIVVASLDGRVTVLSHNPSPTEEETFHILAEWSVPWQVTHKRDILCICFLLYVQ